MLFFFKESLVPAAPSDIHSAAPSCLPHTRPDSRERMDPVQHNHSFKTHSWKLSVHNNSASCGYRDDKYKLRYLKILFSERKGLNQDVQRCVREYRTFGFRASSTVTLQKVSRRNSVIVRSTILTRSNSWAWPVHTSIPRNVLQITKKKEERSSPVAGGVEKRANVLYLVLSALQQTFSLCAEHETL